MSCSFVYYFVEARIRARTRNKLRNGFLSTPSNSKVKKCIKHDLDSFLPFFFMHQNGYQELLLHKWPLGEPLLLLYPNQPKCWKSNGILG